MKFLLFFFTPLAIFSNAYYVGKPVVDMYSSPTKNTDVVSQIIYGQQLKIIKRNSGFYQIESEDGYQGWVEKKNIFKHKEIKDSVFTVKNFFAKVYSVKGTASYPPILTLPYGSMVKVLDTTPKRWIPIQLVDGRKALIQREDLSFSNKLLSLKQMTALSKRFLGLPFKWGGRSTYGYDCSGFVQMLYKHIGIIIPRDTHMQAKSPLLVPVKKEDLQPGDIVFFGKTKIDHSGVYLGDNKFIHCTVYEGGPKVCIGDVNSFSRKYNSAKRPKQDQK